MAKHGELYFIHGCMSASKSAKLITDAYNFDRAGNKVLAIKPAVDTRTPEPFIRSRLGGIEWPCEIRDNLNWKKILDWSVDIYMIDEVHFFRPKDVESLVILADDYDKRVFTFGLRVDTFANMWPTSKRLIEVGATTQELATNCQITRCTDSAKMHLRLENDEVITKGDQVAIDDGKKLTFLSVCRRHFREFFKPGQNIRGMY